MVELPSRVINIYTQNPRNTPSCGYETYQSCDYISQVLHRESGTNREEVIVAPKNGTTKKSGTKIPMKGGKKGC
jgi:hypothetical protein